MAKAYRRKLHALVARLILAVSLTLIVLTCAATQYADAAAKSTPYGDGDQKVTFTQHTAADVERVIAADPRVVVAQTQRPNARLVVRFHPNEKQWIGVLRDRNSVSDLIRITVDDTSGKIVESYALPLGLYPQRLTQREAVKIAFRNPEVIAAAKTHGGIKYLQGRAKLVDGCCWEVDLRKNRSEVLLRVDILDATTAVTGVWTGHQIHWKMARGERGAFGGGVMHPSVWYTFYLLFLLVMFDWRRLKSPPNVDLLALLSFGVSHEFFMRGKLEWSVPLATLSLLWLLIRMLKIYRRGLPSLASPRTRPRIVFRRVPTVMLLLFCVLITGIRAGLVLESGNVIDVGYAGVAGASAELKGEAPWGAMPKDNPHGDTYGPLNYLAYIPATKAAKVYRASSADHDARLEATPTTDYARINQAAQWTAIAADLLSALALAAIGWRWISRRAALFLYAGWVTNPWTTLSLASASNDALVAAALLLALLVGTTPFARGWFIGLAGMIKFAPLALLPVFLHCGRRRRAKQILITGLGFLASTALGILWVVYRTGYSNPLAALTNFWERTIGFQLERESPFSIWGLYELGALQSAAQLAVLLILFGAILWPRTRHLWQLTAGGAVALIASQLVVTHWFYLYIPWFVGFVLITTIATREKGMLSA